MSLQNLNLLKDKHLQKALQHAPDSDAAPSKVLNKTVLDYANKALKVQRETWFSRLKSMFNDFKIARWKLTGMGSLAASLLVVVMIWHENPDDPIQVATAPDTLQTVAEPYVKQRAEPYAEQHAKPKIAQNELVRDELLTDQAVQKPQAVTKAAPVANEPIAASAETIAPEPEDKNEMKVFAKNRPVIPEAAPVASPMDQASVQLKERAASNEAVPMPAPVVAAPAPSVASAEVSENSVAQQSAPAIIAAEQMAEAEAKSDNADSEISSAAAKPTLTSNNALVQAISKVGGKAMANQDIQAGNLRILYLNNSVPADPPSLDNVTGYRVEFIADNSAKLAVEIATYNQAMRDWYVKQNQ